MIKLIASLKTMDPSFLVIICGAVGGFLSMLLPLLNFGPSFVSFRWWLFPAGAAVGAVAAFIGVFLLFNTDRTDRPRLAAWAVLLGLLWQPVLAAGSAFIQATVQKQQANGDLAKATEKLDALEHVAATTQRVVGLADAGASLTAGSVRLQNISDKTDLMMLDSSFSDVAKRIGAAGKLDPNVRQVALNALQNARRNVDKKDQPKLTETLDSEILRLAGGPLQEKMPQ